MMKKILILSPHLEWGGSATANIMIARMLSDNGHDIIYNDEYTELDSYNGIKISHFPFHKNKQNRNNSLIGFVIENDINVVFWGLPQLFAFFYPSVRFFYKNGIVQLTIFHSLSLTSGIRGRISELISAFTVRKMNHIIFVSNYTLNSWSKYYFFRKSLNRSKVIYNAITPPATIHELNDRKPLTIGFVGRFSKEKQPELFCRISESFSGNCIAYGDGPLLQACKMMFPKVEFKGQVLNQEEIYQNIDILIMTSKFENCPMVILETMSYGIPCIAPCVGGIPEIVKNGINGILYDGFTEEDIISKIEIIQKEYALYRNNCLSYIKHYSYETIAKEWEKIFNSK